MAFIPLLQPGQIIDNAALCKHFGCSTQGGMRRSWKTDCLVLICNHVESLYDDNWDGDILHYTGMGRRGDQSLTFQQNKTLSQSPQTHIPVFLFEVFRAQHYLFQGQVSLAGSPYTAQQIDSHGEQRLVWMFPLQLQSQQRFLPSEAEISALAQKKQRQAKKLSDEVLAKLAKRAPKQPKQVTRSVTQIERNPWVAEYTKRRAQGKCDLCAQPAPFSNKRHEPYLENHHIVWLSQGGADAIENTVALCPNCHRKMHVLDKDKDRRLLLARNARREA